MDKVYKLREIATGQYYGRWNWGSIEKSKSWKRSQDAKKEIKYASRHDPIKARAFEVVEFNLVENCAVGYKEDWKFSDNGKTSLKIKDESKDMWK